MVLPTIPCIPPFRDAASVTWNDRDFPVLHALIRNTAMFNYSGHPALALPVGSGLPNTPIRPSIQIVGPLSGDDDVVTFGIMLEKESLTA